MVFQGMDFFLPAAILNFINLQGALVPHCTYQESAAVRFRGATRACVQTRRHVCVYVCVYTYIDMYIYIYIKVSRTCLSLEIEKSICKSHALK